MTFKQLLRDKSVKVFAVSFMAFFLAISLWSLATPLPASPDEAVQIAKAAGEVRGQLTGKLVGGQSSPRGVVKIPEVYANVGSLANCFVNASRPAPCPKVQPLGTRTVPALIYIARYQPLYYAYAGLPTVVMKSLSGVYVMRLFSAALNATFLALAVMAVVRWSRSRFMLAGIMVAMTPAILYFCGMVNPIGLEVSAAVCLWTTALILARERLRDPPIGLIVLLTATICVEALVRSLSPFWAILAIGFVLLVAEWEYFLKFLERKDVWIASGVATLCGLVGAGWIIFVHALNLMPVGAHVPDSFSNAHVLHLALQRSWMYYDQMIGTFGVRLETYSPRPVYTLWGVLLIVLALGAIYVGKMRDRVAVITLVLAIILLPVFISYSQARRLGIVWQGSDTMPLFVGLPILCSAIIANSSLERFRLVRRYAVPAFTGFVVLGSAVSFYYTLRRYAVGAFGPRLAIFHSAWHPPLGVAGLLVSYLIIGFGFVILMAQLARVPELKSRPQAKRNSPLILIKRHTLAHANKSSK